MNGTREIPLSQGKVAMIDEEDYELVGQYSWHVKKSGDVLYAYAYIGRVNGRQSFAAMHNLILPVAEHQEVDHVDLNGLNNTKGNLRIATRQGNCRNRRKFKNSRSRFKGVTFMEHMKLKPWRARITGNDGVKRHLGVYETEEDAARAYNLAAEECFGQFALLNAIPENTQCLTSTKND